MGMTCVETKRRGEDTFLIRVLLPFRAFFILFCFFFFNSMTEYEERAVSLALNRPKLQDLTNRLNAVRLSCPLFDTARWVSDQTP